MEADRDHPEAPEPGTINRAFEAISARQAEQHVYSHALSTYLHDLATVEADYAQAVAKLTETLGRSLGAADKAAGVVVKADEDACTARAAIRALVAHGAALSVSMLEHARASKADGLKIHQLDVDANRRGRAAQARAATLAADVCAARAEVDNAHAAYQAARAAADAADPAATDPWLAEVKLHAVSDNRNNLEAAQARAMIALLREAAGADVTLTNALGAILVDVASSHRHLHEELTARASELQRHARAVEGEVDVRARVRARLEDGDARGLLRVAPRATPAERNTASPTRARRPTRSSVDRGGSAAAEAAGNGGANGGASAGGRALLSPMQRNLAQVEKVGELAKQTPALLSLFSTWTHAMGVVTRSGWLHLFASTDDSEPSESLCLRACAARGESAVRAHAQRAEPRVLELHKTFEAAGYLFKSQTELRWVLRAESAEEARLWLALICEHAHADAAAAPRLAPQSSLIHPPPAFRPTMDGYAASEAAPASADDAAPAADEQRRDGDDAVGAEPSTATPRRRSVPAAHPVAVAEVADSDEHSDGEY